VASLLDGEAGRYRKRATARSAGTAKELRRGRQVPQKSYGEVGRCRKRATARPAGAAKELRRGRQVPQKSSNESNRPLEEDDKEE
jgi:hypothetical protein